jgi:putative transposase
MPVPHAPPVTLAHDEQSRLESIVRAQSTPQALAFRCQVILRTAAPDRPSNLQVATELQCDRHTVGRWRRRYLAHGRSGLQEAPRPGRPRRFSPRRASGGDGDGHP